jgi:beta-lactamase class A
LKILGLAIGMGSLVGTGIALINGQSSPETRTKQQPAATVSGVAAHGANLTAAQLYADLETLMQQHAGLTVSLAWLNLDDQDTAPPLHSLQGSRLFADSELLRLPLLIALFQAVDRGDVQLADVIPMPQPMLDTSLAGVEAPSHSKAPASSQTLEVKPASAGPEIFSSSAFTESNLRPASNRTGSEQAITDSANAATVLQLATYLVEGPQDYAHQAAIALVEPLGGVAVLNRRFQEWGLAQTVLSQEWGADQATPPTLQGKTSATDLVQLLYQVSEGNLLLPRSRDRLWYLLTDLQSTSLLSDAVPDSSLVIQQDLGAEVIAGTVGQIDLPTGRRYLLAILVQSPTERQGQDQAVTLMRRICERLYRYMDQ